MTGILISTFDPNEELAFWTAVQISKQWINHPPVFFSGLSCNDLQSLGFTGDVTDWLNVTLQAVVGMRKRGYCYAYLILDDHPPVGPCDENFLNQQLPALARELDAVCISLLGYGQHRNAEGKILPKQQGFFECCSSDYRWKFSLHPGLWNLEKLQALLEQRMMLYSGSARTIWNFERHQDDPNDPVIGPMMKRCFRICGEHFLKHRRSMQWQLFIEQCERLITDVILYAVKKIAGFSVRTQVEQKLLWRYNHYLGPYPLFWSGTMQQGKPHSGFERWLQRPENKRLREGWGMLKDSILQKKVSVLNPR